MSNQWTPGSFGASRPIIDDSSCSVHWIGMTSGRDITLCAYVRGNEKHVKCTKEPDSLTKSGILPSSSSATTAAIIAELEAENEAEKGLSQALDDLHSGGVMEDATDEEIFEAVQKMHSDRENMEINTGDDGDDSAQDPKPTRVINAGIGWRGLEM
ncbi:hypothetical protein B0H13DRAFT_2303384 [Mycena leptocephala]|nr:hypothetical protein B0H13DRAFT_2303384 [Mycena leptocephala]